MSVVQCTDKDRGLVWFVCPQCGNRFRSLVIFHSQRAHPCPLCGSLARQSALAAVIEEAKNRPGI